MNLIDIWVYSRFQIMERENLVHTNYVVISLELLV